MKIEKVIIHNFRSIKHQEFTLEAYSILFGQNNAGKSNVIRALRCFFDPEFGNKWNDHTDFPNFKTEDNESWIQITFSIDGYNLNDQWKQINKFVNFDKKEKKPTIVLKKYFKYDEKENKIGFYFIKDKKETSCYHHIFQNKNTNFSRSWEFGKLLYIGSKNDSNYSLIKEIFLNIKNLEYDQFEFGDYDLLRNGTCGKEQQIITIFNNYLKDKTKKWIATPFIKINPKKKHIPNAVWNIFKTWNQDNYFLLMATENKEKLNENDFSPIYKKALGIDSFGDGFQRDLNYILLRIWAEINQKLIDKDIPYKDRDFFSSFKLILFEEPELFLHRETKIWLNQDFINATENQKNEQQIIISTHDPIFISLNIKNQKSLLRVSKKNNETKITKKKKLITEKIQKNKHFVWFGLERSAMFLADHVIICEGQTEKAFFEHLLNSDDEGWKKIAKKNFYILDALGKSNIITYMEYCIDFEIDHSVLFDNDSDTKGEKLKQMNKLNLNIGVKANNEFTKGVIMFKDNFEKFLNIKKTKKNSCENCGTFTQSKPIEIIEQFLSDSKNKEKRLKNALNIFEVLLEKTKQNWIYLSWEEEPIDYSFG